MYVKVTFSMADKQNADKNTRSVEHVVLPGPFIEVLKKHSFKLELNLAESDNG